MAFQGVHWTDETKTRKTDPEKIERIKREKDEARQRENQLLTNYRQQQQQGPQK